MALQNPINTSEHANPTIYTTLVVIGCISALLTDDYILAGSLMCLANGFDPIEQDKPWPQRSIRVKLLLGGIALIGIGLMCTGFYLAFR